MTISIYSGKIYLTTNIVNGMQYVGQTTCFYKKYYKGSGKLLKEAFREYGKDQFIIEVLEYVDCRSKLDSREIYWIEEKNTLWPNGYNLTKGGSGTYEYTEKTKRKMRIALKGKYSPSGEQHYNYGKKLSDKTKGKIRETLTGTILSEETKLKLSKCNSGKNNPFYSKKHSDESKKKMSDGQKRRKSFSDDTRRKMSEGHKGKKYKQIKCPHCGLVGSGGAMKRWHFDNCKRKDAR